MPARRLHLQLVGALLALACPSLQPAAAAPSADLWPMWQASDETSDRSVDHGAWQRLLDRYLVVDGDGPNLFRYGAVSADDREALGAYLAQLAGLDPRTLARAEQLAYWINLYNALTVQVVLDHPQEGSILGMGGDWFSRGP